MFIFILEIGLSRATVVAESLERAQQLAHTHDPVNEYWIEARQIFREPCRKSRIPIVHHISHPMLEVRS